MIQTVSPPPLVTLLSVIGRDETGRCVEFHLLPGGTTRIEGDITPNEAARLFWENIGAEWRRRCGLPA